MQVKHVVFDVRVLKKMVNSDGVKGRSAAYKPMNLVALAE
jgi:hypothetical protein